MKPDKPKKPEKIQVVKQTKHEHDVAIRQELAANLHNQALLGVFVSAQALLRIQEEHLYTELGYETFSEYVEEALPISRSQVYVYTRIAKHYAPYFVSSSDKEISGRSNTTLQIRELGVQKLKDIAALEDEDFKALLEGEKLTLKDGDSFDLASFREMAAKSVQDVLVKYRREKREEIARLEEKNRNLNEQNKEFQSRLAAVDEKTKEANEIQKLYGPAARKMKERRDYLAESKKYLDLATGYLFKIEPDPNDPDDFQIELQGAIKRLELMHRNALSNFGYVIRID